jgi:MoxR-like ATPase
VAYPVLRHRLVTTFKADSEGLKPDDVIEQLIATVPVELQERARKLVKG